MIKILGDFSAILVNEPAYQSHFGLQKDNSNDLVTSVLKI